MADPNQNPNHMAAKFPQAQADETVLEYHDRTVGGEMEHTKGWTKTRADLLAHDRLLGVLTRIAEALEAKD